MSKKIFVVLLSCVLVGSCGDKDLSTRIDIVRKLDSINIYIEKDYQRLGDAEKKIKLDEFLLYSNDISIDTLKREFYLNLSKEYKDLNYPTISYNLNHKILKISKEINDSIGIGRSLLNLGFYHYEREKHDSAYSYYYRGERIYSLLGDSDKSGTAEYTMAIIQKNIKDYIGAEASSIRAIEKLTEVKDNARSLASAYNTLGTISRGLGNYDEAIEYYEIAREFRARQRKNRILNAGSYNNIGLVYADKKDYQKAIDFYKKGLDYDSLFNKRPKTYARLLDNLAYARFLSGEERDYPSLFQESLLIRDSLNDRSGLSTNNLHIADYYYKSGYPDAAYGYAHIALDIAKEIQYNKVVLTSLELLMEVSEPVEALKFSKERIRISDSLQKEEKRFQDQFARIRYKSEELEEENTKVNQRLKWSINSILGLLVLGLAGYIIIQRRIARKELNYQENQQRANEEIYSLMLNQQGKLEEGKQIEKQRISEELHDSVLGRLFGIRLSLAGLNNKQGEKVVETRKKFIDELKGLGQEIRQISHDLNASTFAADRLYEEVVENLIQTQCERFELDYDFETDPDISWEAVPDTHKVHLYRIIQESLQNISKHARANTVSVRFRKEQLHHMLTIKDDGVGIEKKKSKKGIGLKNMESRVAKIKGKLYIEGKPGQGTELAITFP